MLRAGGTAAAIVLVAPLFGSLLAYRDLLEALPSEHPVYGIEALSLMPESLGSIEHVATHYLKVMEALGPNTRIMSFSAGGVLAYEIARQLQVLGRGLDGVYLMDCFHNTAPSQKKANYVLDLENVHGLVRIPYDKTFVESMTTDAREQYLRRIFAANNVFAKTYEEVLETFQSLHEAYDAYAPQPGAVTLVQVQGRDSHFGSFSNDWSALVTADLVTAALPLEHNEIGAAAKLLMAIVTSERLRLDEVLKAFGFTSESRSA